MAYRTYVNGVQIFGNNNRYEQWENFIRSQGIEINHDGLYRGEINDFMAAIEACEQIVMSIDEERVKRRQNITVNPDPDPEFQAMLLQETTSQFDLTEIPARIKKRDGTPAAIGLFDNLLSIVWNGCMFVPYTLYLACKEHLEPDLENRKVGHINTFRIKPGHHIEVWAG